MPSEKLEVLMLLDGPGVGERVEIPVGEPELWRDVNGRYCRYRRAPAGLRFTGEILTVQEMADWLEARGATPWLHMDADPPRHRRQRYEMLEDLRGPSDE